MANLSRDDRRKGLDFANELAKMAALAPDAFAKSQVYIAVSALRKLYGFSDADKQKLIMMCLRDGCSTYEDLVAETNLPRQVVVAIVGTMANCVPPIVRLTPLPSMRDNGGRPSLYIQLVKSPAEVLHP